MEKVEKWTRVVEEEEVEEEEEEEEEEEGEGYENSGCCSLNQERSFRCQCVPEHRH